MPGMKTGFEGVRRRYDTSVFDRRLLSNGVPVWVQQPSPIKIHDTGIIMACYLRAGSIQDLPRREGTAHFFEHIPFRGTTSMPNPDAILNPLEEEVAVWNGGTGTYHTEYFVALPQDQLAVAVNTTFELATCPLIREEDVILERGPIQNEYLTKLRGIPRRWSNLAYRQAIWGSHPYVHSPLGYPETINGITADVLRQFQQTHYHANNLQLICGGIFGENEDAFKALDLTFGKLEASSQPAASVPQIPIPSRQTIELIDSSYGADRIVFSWMMPRGSEDRTADTFKLLADTISGRMNSPLINLLRLKLGVLYEAGLASFTQDPNVWIFEISIPVASEHFEAAQDALFECLTGLRETEVLKAQRILQKKRRTVYGFTDAVAVCTRETPDELLRHGRPFTYTEAEANEDIVELGDVFACRDFLLNTPFVTGKIRVR